MTIPQMPQGIFYPIASYISYGKVIDIPFIYPIGSNVYIECGRAHRRPLWSMWRRRGGTHQARKRSPSWITSISAFVFCVLCFFGLEQVLTRVTSLYELAHAFPKLSESPSSSHKAVVYFGNRRYNARAPPIQHNCSSRECV